MRGPTVATRRDMARKERTTGFDGVRELLQKLLYVDLVAVGIVYSPTECGEGGSQAAVTSTTVVLPKNGIASPGDR